jgi:ADP-heptose:LPS heptosyltransferase/GT2 family glycosyltransferase
MFKDYELLAQSGLFDREYYLRTNPDVIAFNIDPLVHYVEFGALERRRPRPDFDVEFYLAQCLSLGETPPNPLVHYLTVGARHGLKTRRKGKSVKIPKDLPDAVDSPKARATDPPSAPATEEAPARQDSRVQMFCDVIEISTGGRFVISGWLVGAAETEWIAVLLDDQATGEAQIGIARPDVGSRFPKLPHARRSGFSLRKTLPPVSEGEHQVILRVRCAGEESDILLPVLAASGSAPESETVPAPEPAQSLRLNIDVPELVDGAVPTPIRGNFEVAGWAVAQHGVEWIEVAINGERIKTVKPGIRRLDVQRALPDWEGAAISGFSAILPHRTLPRGRHTLSVTVRDKHGETLRSPFRIDVEEAPDSEGPWSLRRRMTPAEIDLGHRPLSGITRPPSIGVVLTLGRGPQAQALARTTLASLVTQAYEHWRLFIVTDTRQPEKLRRGLVEGLDTRADQIVWAPATLALDALLDFQGAMSHVMRLRAGDQLGCDALLEFAAHTVIHPDAEFLYCDERRLNASSGKVEAFFKPQWSPDLLLSTNYLGRAWCARVELLRRAAIRPAELVDEDGYQLNLRVTEHATAIRRIPATLVQSTAPLGADGAAGLESLERAIERRGIAGRVTAGRAAGTFRVHRRLAARGLVSIIIPTCAARGLIRTCIDTLRAVTAYRPFEIVCIENIPAHEPASKNWLRANADTVIETAEPFNWSRFNNLATQASKGDYLLFLNDDVEIIDPAWLDTLVEQAARPEVGAVGPQLLYPDQRVQHAGMFLTRLGVARHAFRHAAADDPGYFGLALSQREVTAVTGACLITRRETFEALGRFDENHEVVNNDIDYCLRASRSGLRCIYTPHTRLIHHELASRAAIDDRYDIAGFANQWRDVFAAGDPYFHPRLAKDRDDFAPDWEPVEVVCAGHPVLARVSIRRILVVKLDHIGDCVTALPAIRRLKGHFPAARISVLTSRASKPVWALEPAVDELIEFDFFHARSAAGLLEHTAEEWSALRERLAPYHFDLAVDLRKPWETRSVLQYCGARYLAGFDMKGKFPWLDVAVEWSEDIALVRKRQHTADELIGLVDAIATAAEPDRSVMRKPAPLPDKALPSIPRVRQLFRKRVVCVHPSVGNEMRQWPAEYFGQLIDQLIENQDVHVMLVGSPDEANLGKTVIEQVAHSQSIWSMIGKIRLADLPGLMVRCALFVGNNSGPQHIAAALGVPTVGIHSGVVDAREWGPMGPHAVAIHRAMTCAPCYRATPEECGRGLACLRGVLPADVLRICGRLLGTPATELLSAGSSNSTGEKAALA